MTDMTPPAAFTPAPELHRPLPTDRADAADVSVETTAEERVAVAARLKLPAIAMLTARFRLRRLAEGMFDAEGEISARVTQQCVVTLENFESKLKERFRLRFVPEGREGEIDIDDVVDEVPYQAGMIDLGEATVEQLALSLDPYPRKPGATLPESAEDRSANPFSVLASRRLQ